MDGLLPVGGRLSYYFTTTVAGRFGEFHACMPWLCWVRGVGGTLVNVDI